MQDIPGTDCSMSCSSVHCVKGARTGELAAIVRCTCRSTRFELVLVNVHAAPGTLTRLPFFYLKTTVVPRTVAVIRGARYVPGTRHGGKAHVLYRWYSSVYPLLSLLGVQSRFGEKLF